MQRGELTIVGLGVHVDDVDGGRLQGGGVVATWALDDRLGVTLGGVYDVSDHGLLPWASVHGLVVDRPHVRAGLHGNVGAWWRYNASDDGQDQAVVGFGWSLQAGGGPVWVDLARTPGRLTFEEGRDVGDPDAWRGHIQEAGVRVTFAEQHSVRVGLLSWVPVLSYRYTRGPMFVQASAGANRVEWASYDVVGLQVGWTGSVRGDQPSSSHSRSP